MKYKFETAILAGVLALSSGVTHAADRAQAQDDSQAEKRSQYVQIKLAEGIVSLVPMAVGQQKSREYQTEKDELLHGIEFNDNSLKKMSESDQPLTNWLDTHNQDWQSMQSHEKRLSSQIDKANLRLRIMAKSDNPLLYAKIENEIRSLKGELEKSAAQRRILENRNKALAYWARTGQGDIHLTDLERKEIKSFYKMKRSMIVERSELARKVTVSELKSVATMVAYIPAAMVVGTIVKDMVSSSKRMEKAQASTQSAGQSAALPAVHSQGVTSEAAR